MIAEDDKFLNKMYKLNLADTNHDLTFCANGAEAIDAMDKDQPDILLLDLLMPKVDGFAVLEHVKEKGYKFPVVILTNLSQEVDQKKCKELGAKDFIVKSDLELDQLLSTIKKFL